MAPDRSKLMRAVIVACPFTVVAAAVPVPKVVGAILADTWNPQWWDLTSFLVVASWVTYGIAVACFLAVDAVRVRRLPEQCWRDRRHMVVGTLASAGLGTAIGLAVAIVAATLAAA